MQTNIINIKEDKKDILAIVSHNEKGAG